MNKRLAAFVSFVVVVVALAVLIWRGFTDAGESAARIASSSSDVAERGAPVPLDSRAEDLERAEVADVETSSAPEEEIADTAPQNVEQVRIFGRVIDSEHAPIAGAEIAANVLRVDQAPAQSDSSGRFEFEVDARRLVDSVLLIVAARTFEARYVQAPSANGGEIDVGDVELARGGVVAGRVVDSAGAPVRGAKVIVDGLQTPYERLAEFRRVSVDRLGWAWPNAKSAEDGSFELIGLPAGRTRLVAGADGYLTTYSEIIDLTAARERSGLVLTLDAFEREDFVRGIVLDPSGEPAPDVLVNLAGERCDVRGRTEPDGRFVLFLERRESVDLVVIDKGQKRFAMACDVPPGSDLSLSLRAMRVVPFTAHDAAGAEIPHASMSVELAARRSLGLFRSRPGESEALIPPCEFTALVQAPGFATAVLGPLDGATIERIEATLTPVAASAAPLATPKPSEPDVTPPPVQLDIEFHGQVVVDGEPPQGVWTIDLGEARDRDSSGPLHRVQLDTNGRFTWSKPAEGVQQLKARIVGGDLDGATFVETLHVTAATADWRRELATARVRVEGAFAIPLLLVWLGPNDAWAARPLRSAGEFTLFEGETRIVAMPSRAAQKDPPSTWPALASGSAKHGEVLVLRAP